MITCGKTGAQLEALDRLLGTTPRQALVIAAAPLKSTTNSRPNNGEDLRWH